ncbi:lamin tail domain-containing protein [Bacteroides sp. 214]|uniref:OadG family transporter subunit n=1 Tax=Bacteroides sp. 214 TaxID=2302935 RepID=UPI0013D5B828|nr:OadG family transporter subunit [Bacteroides sp. 214]NDW13730.1 lamin tail domain-containing protein [Bacteroides sp. 214]
MNKKRFGILVVLMAAFCLNMQAQSATSLRINEVLIVNETNFQDDYGVHSAWIEIYNTSYASVDIKGCFLTNDENNPTMYPIPKSDVLTLIKPRQHVIFWADGQPSRGTFHVNFTLDPTKKNYIALYDSNGKTLIDKVEVPAGLLADQSYARIKDGHGTWETKTGGLTDYVTPSTNNMTLDSNKKIDNFKKHDSIGIGMAITAMLVVFSGLILLYVIFKFVGNTAVRMGKRNAMKAHGITDKTEAKEKGLGQRSGEEFAAISMAMHEFLNDAHDYEDMIITINKVKRTYSPWSSKIYTLRETPKR